MAIPGPDTRVIELRVHGILGTTPERLTDSVAAVEVAGDGLGRVVRPADRLRRPAPGPVLQTTTRPVPRIVEGYLWGRMTSGGLAKAAWALLFPFAMANVAHWMLPPARAGSKLGFLLGHALRALLRVAALLLTALLVAQVTVISLDLIAAQCLQPGGACLAGVAPEWLRGEQVRIAIGLVPPALLVVLLHQVGKVDWEVNKADAGAGANPVAGLSGLRADAPPPPAQSTVLPGDAVEADPDTPALRSLHTTGALATAAAMATGGVNGPLTAAASQIWLTAIGLFVLCLIGVLLLDDPVHPGAAPSRRLRMVLGAIPRKILVTLGGAVLLASAVVIAPLPPTLATGGTIDVISAVFVGCALIFAILLAPAAWSARPIWASRPRNLRPWAGGWTAAPVLAMSGMLGAGFGAGVALTIVTILGSDHLTPPAAYETITVLWGAAAVLSLATLAVLVPVVLTRRWLAEHHDRLAPAEATLLHAGRPEDRRTAARAWWWANLERQHLHHALLAVAAVLTLGTAVSIIQRAAGVDVPGWLEPLATVGVIALAVLALALLRTVYLAKSRPNTARMLGVLADLTCFWPREAHPTVPPCYALKVVPELVHRATEHLRDPATRVVLVGHSQGSLLAAVAAGRLLRNLPESDRSRIGLVTAGSQLHWAFPRAFPAVVPHESLRELSGSLSGRWRALCRGTDPLGGGVTTWNRQVYEGTLIGVGFRGDGTEGPLPSATRSPSGALVLGGDHWLPDPARGPFTGRRWNPGVSGHNDFNSDPEWDRAVAIAAGLELPPRGQAGEYSSLLAGVRQHTETVDEFDDQLAGEADDEAQTPTILVTRVDPAPAPADAETTVAPALPAGNGEAPVPTQPTATEAPNTKAGRKAAKRSGAPATDENGQPIVPDAPRGKSTPWERGGDLPGRRKT
ncbi:hypothetical protein [Actinoalloteichus hymeniacidonis]|uniref:Lipase (Class 3) n=1 Tax=Actinoalloteichus hymeniacidonis TaxID=340345 RepID=A0AAC9MZI6_9PSEU|nr:hypothetical protein [Actinoalloteichus hymeniacidonis]AOS65443.1 hypothetical protein TL08_23315 [Actinoalloteichus hymeniacidonis]MBB5906470.1 putative membrane protein (Fun14 family) [Actinoalloteichus hymeniacidonis]